jgi:hypothetical protein
VAPSRLVWIDLGKAVGRPSLEGIVLFRGKAPLCCSGARHCCVVQGQGTAVLFRGKALLCGSGAGHT